MKSDNNNIQYDNQILRSCFLRGVEYECFLPFERSIYCIGSQIRISYQQQQNLGALICN